MTTYKPATVKSGVESGEVSRAIGETAREQRRSATWRRGPRRGTIVFVSGFMLGAVATAAASIFGRGVRMPFVLGNRNTFVSLPLSGITMAAPSVRAKGIRRRPTGFAAWSSKIRGKKLAR